jgi:hypothetical protein
MDIDQITIVIDDNYGYQPVTIVIGESRSSRSIIIYFIHIYCTIIPLFIVIGKNTRYCPFTMVKAESYGFP